MADRKAGLLGVPSENTRHYPVGSLAELRAAFPGISDEEFAEKKMLYATCSKPSNESRGCQFRKKCVFGKYREAADKHTEATVDDKTIKAGPRNVGVALAFDGGAAAEKIMPCFRYMANGHPIAELSPSQHALVIAEEGETILTRETVAVEPKNPKSFRHKLTSVERVVPEFPRPSTTLASETHAQRIRDRSAKIREEAKADRVFGRAKFERPAPAGKEGAGDGTGAKDM